MIVIATEFKKKVCLEAQKENRFLRGRQIANKIYDYFRVTGTSEAILDFSDLINVHYGDTTSKDLIRNGTKFFNL